jgi:hypothetical protein
LVVLYEQHALGEVPDVIGWKGAFSWLVECKVNRSDFLRDRRKPWRTTPETGMGFRRYYMVPLGLVAPVEVPKDWGLIVARGHQARMVKESADHAERNLIGELNLASSTLRRVQIRLGNRPLAEWARYENRFEAARGIPPQGHPARPRGRRWERSA